jgi:hypothetical protein
MVKNIILHYPKSIFTREDVIKEHNQFKFPFMWRFKENKRNFAIKLIERRY